MAIVPKDLGEPINGINIVRSNMDTGSVTIAYRIGKAWWRKGYTSEAFATVIKFLFEEVGVNRIEATHPQENPNSGKVMAKCGLKYEGTLRQAGKNNQGVFDELCYAILAEDYFGASKPPQSYIMNLRKYVGHIPLIMNGAGVIIENERGEILLGDGVIMTVGHMQAALQKLGESCEDTARRSCSKKWTHRPIRLNCSRVFWQRYTLHLSEWR